VSDYVLINDVHLSDRAPASCTDTYLDDLFDLLDQAAGIAQSRDGGIILAGDVFHHKAPSRTTHSTVMRLIDWARLALVPVYAVIGNHDIQHDRTQSIHETQPLGVVMASGAINLLDGWIEDGEEAVYGVPWQMTWDDAAVADALREYRELSPLPQTAPRLVVTHAPLYPPGQELKYEFYPAAAFAKAMGGQGTVHYGHVHEPHGIYTVDGVTFSNPGALSRGSLHEHNLQRTPAIAIWDSNTGQIEHVELTAKPASEVFNLKAAAAIKSAGINLNRFLASVQATKIDVTSKTSVLAHVREQHPDDLALVALVETLLEQVA
jgi:DNA repair exonuclease SbcCD nuclease subunit